MTHPEGESREDKPGEGQSDKPRALPLATPPVPAGVHADIVAAGLPIPPLERIRLFDDSQWEDFVSEWAQSLKDKYSRVERCGGAGDLGRDVIAYSAEDESVWDNYQCKHKKDPLQPSGIWCELGKLVYYTHRGDYPYPRKYYFVAPQGAGTKLSMLLRDADKLRIGLFANWDTYCKGGITSTRWVPLDAVLKEYAESLDFSIFNYVPPLDLIEQHAATPYHIARFGGGLPPRPNVAEPPAAPTAEEARYVKALLDAYGDHLKKEISSVDAIEGEEELADHLLESRRDFYSAEALRAFSRDTLPAGAFGSLQGEVHVGIKDEVRAKHEDGYRRVVSVVRAARSLQVTSHALVTRLTTRDRGGICHQLANDGAVKWVK